VTDRFALLDRLTAFEVQHPGFAGHGTGPATGRAGLLGAEGLGLLLQEDDEGTLGQARGGFLGQRLQGAEVDVQPWAFGAESTPGHDFSPGDRQFTDVPEVFRLEWSTRHSHSCLGLGRIDADAFFLPFYAKQLFPAK